MKTYIKIIMILLLLLLPLGSVVMANQGLLLSFSKDSDYLQKPVVNYKNTTGQQVVTSNTTTPHPVYFAVNGLNATSGDKSITPRIQYTEEEEMKSHTALVAFQGDGAEEIENDIDVVADSEDMEVDNEDERDIKLATVRAVKFNRQKLLPQKQITVTYQAPVNQQPITQPVVPNEEEVNHNTTTGEAQNQHYNPMVASAKEATMNSEAGWSNWSQGEFRITTYGLSCRQTGCGKGKVVGKTASGAMVQNNKTLACSKQFYRVHATQGTQFQIEGFEGQVFECQDTGRLITERDHLDMYDSRAVDGSSTTYYAKVKMRGGQTVSSYDSTG